MQIVVLYLSVIWDGRWSVIVIWDGRWSVSANANYLVGNNSDSLHLSGPALFVFMLVSILLVFMFVFMKK